MMPVRPALAAIATTLLALAALIWNSGLAQAHVLVDPPDLSVRVGSTTDGCNLGQRCRIVVSIVNLGDGRFAAPITLRVGSRPQRLRLIRAGGRNWSCDIDGGALSCHRRRQGLAPGELDRFTVDAYVPPEIRRPNLRVCAEVDWQGPGAMKARNRLMQEILNEEGYDAGPPDGIVGPVTRDAIARLQADAGLPITGVLDHFLLRELTGRWGIGDAKERNDRRCIKISLFDTGHYSPPPRLESPARQVSPGDGTRLRCPRNRVQSGRTCICRHGLEENEAGECIAAVRTRERPEALPETEREDERTVPAEDENCGPNGFRNSAGRCTCLPDFHERDGRCVKRTEAKGTEPEAESTEEGTEPEAESAQEGTASEEPAEQTHPEPETTGGEPERSCRDDMILNEEGKCQCYLGLKNSEGKCLARVRVRCLPGEILNVRGKCECPEDHEIRDGRCVPKE